MQLGYVGLGNMGAALARRLLRKHKMRVYDLRPEAMARLADLGGIASQSPKALAAECDLVMTCLPTSKEVQQVVFGSDGLASGLKKGAIIVDHSTTLPDATRTRAERHQAQGIRYLHAPVFMSPQMAESGIGLILVSGPQAEFDEVRSELEGMTGEVWYLGERPDLAAAYKLFGNCMLFAISGGLADIIAMARANDIDAVEAMKLFTKFLPGNVIAARGPRMARNEVTPTSFEISMARKDVGLMMTAAKDQPLVGLPCIAKRMDELIKTGKGGLDITAIGPAAK